MPIVETIIFPDLAIHSRALLRSLVNGRKKRDSHEIEDIKT